jgi:putative SOS response-associated peptidase YedK
MCGRFVLYSSVGVIDAEFGVAAAELSQSRYNIAPGQEVFCVRSDNEQLTGELLRWGLVPFWAKDPAVGNRMINARAETVDQKPSYRQAFSRRRCLIPADGFYEWVAVEQGKQPWFISSVAGSPLAFAGLWDEWRSADDTLLRSCTIITAGANQFMSELHHRMPVIVAADNRAQWLDDGTDNGQLQQLLAAGQDVELQAWPVSKKVNNPVHDVAELISPITT